MKQIDLNCDMGESYGAWRMGQDEAIMPYVTSANIACGAHAGDPSVMMATVSLARKHGVSIGAHPGYPDILGFGRRHVAMPLAEVGAWVLYQLGALHAIARSQGADLAHVKPHGALYNEACADRQLADAIADAVSAFSRTLLLVCLPGSALEEAGTERGLTVAREGFADRTYEPDGLLSPRSTPGSVLTDPAQAAAQAVRLASGELVCRDGTRRSVAIDTLCVHGDTPGAAMIAAAARAALEQAGVATRPMYLVKARATS